MRLHALVRGKAFFRTENTEARELIGLALSYNFLSDRNTCNFIGRPEEFWHDNKVTGPS